MPRLTILVAALVGCAAPDDGALVEGRASMGRTLQSGCPGSKYGKIQDAISAASRGDVVEVCPGTYAERLTIRKDLTLRASGGAEVTTIDAEKKGRALTVSEGAHVVVEGFTFRGGVNPGAGGDVRCEKSKLELRDNVLMEGDAFQGGGVGYVRCEGVVEDNRFAGNHADYAGGGLYVLGDAKIRGNTFEANAATYGGGGYAEQSWGTVAGNTFLRNTSTDDGGGFYVLDGAPSIEDNAFEENDSSDEGGGLRVKGAEATITGNTFTSNHADYRGGAMKVSHDEVVMVANTYVGNTSWVAGGAVVLYESASELSGERYVENTAGDTGGGLAILTGWGGVTVEDCAFEGNRADEGGHVYVALPDHTTSLRRLDLVGGKAERGGALFALTSELSVRNSIVVANEATVSGGGFYLAGVTGRVANAVFADNRSPDGSALRVKQGVEGLDVASSAFVGSDNAAISLSDGVPPTLRYSDFSENLVNVTGLPDPIGLDGNLDAPPGFVDADARDFGLVDGSALRDAGDPAVRDLDGSRCDIGVGGGPGA